MNFCFIDGTFLNNVIFIMSHTLPFFAIYDFCYVVEKLKSSVCVWLFVKLNQETLS